MTRHRFDPLSFVFGALFVAVAVIASIDPRVVDLPPFIDLRWIAPVLLVLLGALLLVFSGRNGDAVADDRAGSIPEAEPAPESGLDRPVGTTPDLVHDDEPHYEPDDDGVGGSDHAPDGGSDGDGGDDPHLDARSDEGSSIPIGSETDPVEGDAPER